MKIHLQDAEVRSHLFEGGFGLEKESLRIESKTGKMAQSLHPFSHSKIVQDFAENQTEINTAVYPDWQSARRECEELTVLMQNILARQGETLWPFSNPPMISSMEDIPMLQSGLSSSTEYRHYLADRYGKMKMLFSGIHYNFSFSDSLLKREYTLYSEHNSGTRHEIDSYKSFRNAFYLDLAQKAVWYGWIIDALLNASPVFDGSLMNESACGQPLYFGFSSMRNSIHGFWNFFTPWFDYTDMQSYTSSIEHYVEEGLLKAPRELYYPVRIKPASAYSLDALNSLGASHIELRMIDLNPYELSGISADDAYFCHLFLVFLACLDDFSLSMKDQIYAIQNFKNSCVLPLDQARILYDVDTGSSALEELDTFLSDMEVFFERLNQEQAVACLRHQKLKIQNPKSELLASRVRKDFSSFMKDGLKQAQHLQQLSLDQPARKNAWTDVYAGFEENRR